MGLPLAPEQARMRTAFLLRDYTPPSDERHKLYFDEVPDTYPIEDLPLGHYNLKPTTQNTNQHLPKSFTPTQQQFRQPVPLHPSSYHPSKIWPKSVTSLVLFDR